MRYMRKERVRGEEYWQQFETYRHLLPTALAEEGFNLHDATIANATWAYDDKMLVLDFDTSNSLATVQRLVFTGVLVLEQECELLDACWIYDEVYPAGNGEFEFHALLCQKKYCYFTIGFKHVAVTKL